jgi:acyl-CoA thioester hydrolase
VVAELHIKYRRPSFYDQVLQLDTTCTRVTASRAEHGYAVKDKATGVLLAEGSTTLACVDAQGKIQRMPQFMQIEPER